MGKKNQDSCRLSLVSPEFKSAAEYDVVWGSFLPPDYEEIIARACTPFQYSSKKQLFRWLCDSILIDGGTKTFALEKSNGRKSYIMSTKELYISQADDPNHWSWITIPESRFDEVAELKTISNLEIEGRIKTQALSPSTKYGAFLIIKVSHKSFGLDSIPSEISLKIGDLVVKRSAYLCGKDVKKQQMEVLFYKNRLQMLNNRLNHQGFIWEEKQACERLDGWMKIEVGEFFTGFDDACNDKELQIRLTEVKGQHLKGGLIIEGIEVRPK
ncbi:hypothetical protein LIER_39743 [Lithospermum erythrorhizon]|uniref:Uncharacterized protein n=1 Tax=Lithospermum erythrorhizon TaxID=34254 RepID=A0AAV3QJN3_LITER